MILSKDLQEILEGVHYFLAEALTRESLSGRAECLRRGLVLQLEALTGAYPTLRICPAPQGTPRGGGVAKGGSSSASLPYLPMDQAPVRFAALSTTTTTTTTTTTAYSSSSSSSGVNSSSSSSNSGSSGDGQRIGPGAPLIEEGGGGEPEEVYEEFDEYKDEGVELKPEKGGGGGGGGGGEEVEEEDGVYTETHDPVAFSSLIATCERHGALGKKTKGLLRNIKSYLCVVAGGMLYLYVKETDDRQKKSIDLSGYTARSATGEDIKDTKKKDAAFEIVCPGRKTHTFIARTAKDKNEWLDALSRTIRGGKTRPSSTHSHAPQTTPLPPTHISLPLKPPSYQPAPPPGLVSQSQEEGEEYCLYNDVEEEELYEEIQGEEQGGGLSLPPPPSSILSPSPIPHAPPHTTTASSTQPAYDPVDSEPPPAPGSAPPRPPPPTRKPQPTHTQNDGEDSDDSQGIYCEIADDVLENARKVYDGEIPAPDMTGGILNAPVGPFKPPSGGLGSLSKEIFRSLDATTGIRPQVSSPSAPPSGPPRLPPKGVPAPEAEESEYKVPQNSDTEYHVPSSTPVSPEAPKAPGQKISGPLPTPNLLPVSQTPTILPIKPVERRTSTSEDKKTGVSSFRSGTLDPNRGLRSAGGTSVRDMIARLNQRKPENEETKEAEEEEEEEKNAANTSSVSSVPSTPSTPSSTPSAPSTTQLSVPKQNLKTDKPPLPSRPPNLRAGGSVSPIPPEKKEQEEEEDDWDEVYEVLDDDDDAPPQQQAEWYIAKFAFVATLDQALSFGRGDELLVYDTSGTSGWWRATLRGRSGLVPREYLKKKH